MTSPSSLIPPIRSDESMTAAHILAELADGGVEPEPETEEQVVFEDQTLEEIDIDILVFRGHQQLNSNHSAYFAEILLELD